MKHNRKCTEVTYQLKSISWKYNFFFHRMSVEILPHQIFQNTHKTPQNIFIYSLYLKAKHTVWVKKQSVDKQWKSMEFWYFKIPWIFIHNFEALQVFIHTWTHLSLDWTTDMWGILLKESLRKYFATSVVLALWITKKALDFKMHIINSNALILAESQRQSSGLPRSKDVYSVYSDIKVA